MERLILLIRNALGPLFRIFFDLSGGAGGEIFVNSQVINNFCHIMCTDFLKKFIFFEKIAIFVDKSP